MDYARINLVDADADGRKYVCVCVFSLVGRVTMEFLNATGLLAISMAHGYDGSYGLAFLVISANSMECVGLLLVRCWCSCSAHGVATRRWEYNRERERMIG